MKLFTLIYSESAKSTFSKVSVVGPELFTSEESLYSCLMKYVIPRTQTFCLHDFEVWAGEKGLHFVLDEHNQNNLDIEHYLLVKTDIKKQICDWYFDNASDKDYLAFFTITEHIVPKGDTAIMPKSSLEIEFFDHDGNSTCSKSSRDIDPFTQAIKNHFFFGGWVKVGQDKVLNHKSLASLIC